MTLKTAVDETLDALDGKLCQDEHDGGEQEDSMVADWLSRFNISNKADAKNAPSTEQRVEPVDGGSKSVAMVADATTGEDEIVLMNDDSSQTGESKQAVPVVAPETRRDLAQLREVANSTAMGNMAFYACRKAVQKLCFVSIIAPIVMGMSIYSVVNCPSVSSFRFGLSCTLFLVATELVRRCWVTFDRFRKMLAPMP